MKGKSIVISGAIAQKPKQGGHTWVFLQYVLGFRRLGWDVIFIDRLVPGTGSEDVAYAIGVARRFGFEDSYAVIAGDRTIGLSKGDLLARIRNAPLLLNFMGYLQDEELLESVACRVFVDIDPGFGQMWHELGQANLFTGHDRFVTVGRNIGQQGCVIPTCGFEWIPTPQPVVLDLWPEVEPKSQRFTSIGAWRGPYDPISYGGRTYGLRVHEFRKFMSLPRLTSGKFEVALDIHESDLADLQSLQANDWKISDPRQAASGPEPYQEFIHRSGAEFMVAKEMYVASNSGWFSDRSICYLATGRPVLAQDTGLADFYPTDEGLIAFSTLEEAVVGTEEILANYGRHSKAARGVAVDHFESDKVLSDLLEKLEP